MVLRYVGPNYTFEQQRVEINNLANDVAGLGTPAYSTPAGYASTAGIATYATTAGIATFVLTNPGVGIQTSAGLVGTGATILDFRGSGISTVTVTSGIATINIIGPDISPVMMSMIF